MKAEPEREEVDESGGVSDRNFETPLQKRLQPTGNELLSPLEPVTLAGLLVLFAVGAFGTGILLGELREPFVALGGLSVFGAVMILLITRERRLAATVTRSISLALGENHAAIVRDLETNGPTRYVPVKANTVNVRVFQGRDDDVEIPPVGNLENPVVTIGNEFYGISFDPAGRYLFREFQSQTDREADSVENALQALSEGLTDLFELAESVAVEDISYTTKGDFEEVRVRIDGSVIGGLDYPDHPIQSFFAVGLVHAVERPLEAECSRADGSTIMAFRFLPGRTDTDIWDSGGDN